MRYILFIVALQLENKSELIFRIEVILLSQYSWTMQLHYDNMVA